MGVFLRLDVLHNQAARIDDMTMRITSCEGASGLLRVAASSNTFAYTSRFRGKMQAFGQDGHAAMLLEASQHMVMHLRSDGTVAVIFQRAEESGSSGAR